MGWARHLGGVGLGEIVGVSAACRQRGQAGVAGSAHSILAVDLEGTGGGSDRGSRAASVVRGALQGEGEEARQAV
ncbi:hypothetical protein V493_06013 [Pseudogymnoascus sp. VKM F-4281 (FW-2241)]|nr:hypothetical protein V493_06013 [Pseudogymnoascus sp. VKM F-4281 (FW-2241)]